MKPDFEAGALRERLAQWRAVNEWERRLGDPPLPPDELVRWYSEAWELSRRYSPGWQDAGIDMEKLSVSGGRGKHLPALGVAGLSLEDALLEVVYFLEERQVPYMVIGGFANLFWRRSRVTRDLDLTVSCAQDRLAGLVEGLRHREAERHLPGLEL